MAIMAVVPEVLVNIFVAERAAMLAANEELLDHLHPPRPKDR